MGGGKNYLIFNFANKYLNLPRTKITFNLKLVMYGK